MFAAYVFITNMVACQIKVFVPTNRLTSSQVPASEKRQYEQIFKYMEVDCTFPCRFLRGPSLLYTSASFYHLVSKQFEIMKQLQFQTISSGIEAYRKTGTRVPTKYLRGIPENQDLGFQWDPSGTLQKPKNRDPRPWRDPTKTGKLGP